MKTTLSRDNRSRSVVHLRLTVAGYRRMVFLAGTFSVLLFSGVLSGTRAEDLIGGVRPENSLVLTVTDIDATEVTLSWTNAGAAYDSVKIWYGTAPVPDDSVPALYASVTLSGLFTTAPIQGLAEQTAFFFGIQGKRQGLWSDIPAYAKASATTLSGPSEAIVNTMKIFDVTYDTALSKIRVTFTIDDLGFQQRFGFSWIQRGPGIAPLPAEFLEPSLNPHIGEIDYTKDLGQVITYEFDPVQASPPLEYAAGYYFSGWVSKVGKTWALPTDSSIFYYTLPQPMVVPVKIFRDKDVVTAFSSQVVLRKVDGVDTKVNLCLEQALPLNGSGLVPASIAFSLTTTIGSPIRLLVGLAYNAALIPAGATVNDIRMYHYDKTGSVWLIDTAAIIPDPTLPVLYVQKFLPDCTHPFFLAVDMVPPTLTVAGDTSSVITWNDKIAMTVQVQDNVANPSAWLFAGRGDEAMQCYFYGPVTAGLNMPWEIAAGIGQGECGIRVHVVTSDGRNSTVADVSRDVYVAKSDGLMPVSEQWVPLSATGVLDTPLVKQVLNEYRSAEGTWKYDIFQLRLFRFLKTGWVEYTEANQDLFRFEPGRVIWMKTRKEEAIDLGSGRTVSLKSPYGIRLPAKSWTDFCLPYRFDIRIGDILLRNNAVLNSSMQFYRWDKSAGSGRYSATGIYLPSNGVGGLTDTLFHRRPMSNDKVAYTVWNPLPTDDTLWIPGIPLVYSSVSMAKSTVRTDLGWSVVVRSSDQEGDLNPVFCAYNTTNGGTVTYPQPPMWSKVKVGIYDRAHRTVCGNLIAHNSADGGYTCELVFENNTPDRKRVSYTVERLAGDRKVEIAVTDPETGTVAAGESDLSVDVEGMGRAYRFLSIGSSGYVHGFGNTLERGSFALGRIAPNPFRGRVAIEFTVPYGRIERVRCDVLDHRGRILWSALPGAAIHPGKNSVRWDPDASSRLAAGSYFVRLTGYDGRGRIIGEKTAKVMYIP